MTDFDPDAYLANKDEGAAAPFDPDAYLSQPQAAPTVRTPPTAQQHASDVLSIATKHPFTAPLGLLENAASGVTGGVGSLADAVTLSQPGTHDWAYRPRTEAGKEIAAVGADESAAIGRGYSKVFGEGPLAETVKQYGPEALGAIGTVTGLGEIPRVRAALRSPVIDPQAALDTAAASSKQSMGAAASAPRLSSLSPELQEGVRKAVQQTGGAINPEILTRHVEADSLPVPMRLSEGEATQDPRIISNEMNARARTPGMVEHKNANNQKLVDNIQAIRDRAGPDVFSTNPVEHGDTLIDSYRQKDAPIKADITAKYKALEDTNGGQFPLDTDGFVRSADAALSKALKSNSVPSDLAATLNEFRNGRQMTFEDFESLRSDAADAARTSTDGRQRAAAGIIRDQLEKMPLTAEAAKLKPLADAARAAAKARFDALDADPAYDAAVHGTVPPDRFVHRFVTGAQATRDGVATMRENLTDNPVATQTLSVAALDHLRQAAGIDPMGNGNFGQAAFNKALVALDPKLRSLVDPKTAEQLSTLGNVARYTQFQPSGHFVNNSNTFVAAIASHLAKPLEIAGNTMGGGLIPFGTMARESLAKRAATRAATKSLEPGAGLGRLRDVGK
jgi:hypothetical protein